MLCDQIFFILMGMSDGVEKREGVSGCRPNWGSDTVVERRRE